jgi:hypothetical protein
LGRKRGKQTAMKVPGRKNAVSTAIIFITNPSLDVFPAITF